MAVKDRKDWMMIVQRGWWVVVYMNNSIMAILNHQEHGFNRVTGMDRHIHAFQRTAKPNVIDISALFLLSLFVMITHS